MKTSLWLSLDKQGENDLSVGGYVYSFNNPINFTDPDGNWPDYPSWKEVQKSYNAAKNSVVKSYNSAKISAAKSYNEAKKYTAQQYIKAKVSTVSAFNQTKEYLSKKVDKAKEKVIEVSQKPLVSITNTTKEVVNEIGMNTGVFGDKYTYEKSMSTTVGKPNGMINVDVASSINGNFDSVTFSLMSGTSVGFSGSGMISGGQSIGNNDYHFGVGLGIGLGEFNIGSSTSNKGVTFGGDITMRPGVGTLATAAAIYTAPAWAPVAASALPAAASALPILLTK